MSNRSLAIWFLAFGVSGVAFGLCLGYLAGYDHGSVDAWNAAAEVLDKVAEQNQLSGLSKLRRLKYTW